MKRCKHKNGVLLEFINANHAFIIMDGKQEGHLYKEIGDIQGYEYQCDDCKRSWKYGAWPKLKWLQKIHNQLS